MPQTHDSTQIAGKCSVSGLLVDFHTAPSYPAVSFVPDDPKECDVVLDRCSRDCFSELGGTVVQVQALLGVNSTLPFTLTVSTHEVGFA